LPAKPSPGARRGSKGEVEGFVSISTSLEKDVDHFEGQGVIVSHGEQLCIGTEIFYQFHCVLSGILLPWMVHLNLALKFIEAVNGR
jgi:hypothetical protein